MGDQVKRPGFRAFVCDACGWRPAKADEDGCCATCGADCRLIELVERDPAAERVVKAARRVLWHHGAADLGEVETIEALVRAVEAYEKRRARR